MNFGWLKKLNSPTWHRLSAALATAAGVCAGLESVAAVIPRQVSVPVLAVCAFITNLNTAVNKKPAPEPAKP